MLIDITGAGGSYGYPTLSEVARSLELAAKAHDNRRSRGGPGRGQRSLRGHPDGLDGATAVALDRAKAAGHNRAQHEEPANA